MKEMAITVGSAALDVTGASAVKALSHAGKFTGGSVVEAVVGSITRGVDTPLTIIDAVKSVSQNEKEYK